MALEPLIYDETTGLPKLPEGFAWKVEEYEYPFYEEEPENAVLVIRIVKRVEEKNTWWDELLGRKKEVKWITRLHDYSGTSAKTANTPEALKDGATKVYNKLRDIELEKAKLASLIGLYPPKSIL